MEDVHDQANGSGSAIQQDEDNLDTVLLSPKSPRQLAVQAIKRAASLREGNASSAQPSPRGVARLGLERSASDAARRMAMAKLNGETIVAPPEYTVPKTPLHAGPPPSLADLQARAEQRLALGSPEPVQSTSLSRNNSFASGGMLSRNNSTISHTMLSRSPSAASSGLSRNASLARAKGAMSPSHSAGDMSIEEEPATEEGQDLQKKTEERQEARTNLIRKLSRGRLAAGAAAGARERAEARNGTATTPSTPGLQRRPSLAEVLARAENRAQETPAEEEMPNLPQDAHQLGVDIEAPLPTASSIASALRSGTSVSHTSSRAVEASTPSRTNLASPASNLSSAISSKGMYDHIPVPPMPDTPESMASPPGMHYGTSSHESIYSAVSNFRPYRHTVERDRDSAIARLDMEDNFEFELGTEGGPHERHPLSVAEDIPVQETLMQLAHKDRHALADSHVEGLQTPPDSPLDANMLVPARGTEDVLKAPSSRLTPQSLSPEPRQLDSMPETPEIASPVSPFSYTQAPPLPSTQLAMATQTLETQAQPESGLSSQEYEGRKGHATNFSTDSFPVSVATSHSSRHPQSFAYALDEHPPLPSQSDVGQTHHLAASANMEASPLSATLPEIVPLVQASGDKSRVGLSGDRGAPSPEGSAASRDGSAPATAAAEYRFPTTMLANRELVRPASLASNEGLDTRMDRMIDQLEALQAAEQRSQPNRPQAQDQPTHLKQAVSHAMQAQNSASALHEFHITHQPVHHIPHEIKDRSAISEKPPIIQSTLPIPPATGADYAKYADSKLAPFPGLVELERQRASPAPSTAGSFQAADRAAPAAGQAKSGATQERDLASRDLYHSDGSAQNDSAPSLARTGTASSTSSGELDARPMPPVPSSGVTKDQIMKRLNDMLAGQPEPAKPTALDIPPRQLLLHAPVLQVVNANTVKDRYLLLFTDILIIAKPLVEENSRGEPVPPTLDTRFLVKSIVELPKLKLTAQAAETGEDAVQKRKHPLLLTFVDRFANDPKKAISALIAKAGLSNDPSTIANLLFRNPELNRSQLGSYLSMKEQKPVLKAYCDRFRLAGLRIEDALRVFIASLRLPNDYGAAGYLLGVFSSQWLLNNPGTGMTNDSVFATKLVISIMELNDALHSGIDDETAAAGNLFSFPNHAITVDDFIAAFRLKDPHGALPDEHLTRIYLSIRKDRVQQAADNSIASVTPEIEVITHPARLPNRLTYGTPSENISVTLPKVDPKFSIRLVGQDLRFEPSLLTFARSRTATFRVTPTALGSKSMLFIKLGTAANLYRNLPVNKTFSVERAFMNHTFQIAFVNHLNVKRKYLFSMGTAEAKFTWVDTLRQRIENSPVEQEDTPRATKAAAAVSLQVLRDALIAPDEPVAVLANKPSTVPGRPGFTTPPGSRGGLRSGAGGLQRSNSFSKTYPHGLGKAEADLLTEQRRPSGGPSTLGQALNPLGRRGSRDDSPLSKRGLEVVTMVQQNSLLPLVLGFASAGAGVDAMPRKAVPNPLPAQATPPQLGRGTGRFRNL